LNQNNVKIVTCKKDRLTESTFIYGLNRVIKSGSHLKSVINFADFLLRDFAEVSKNSCFFRILLYFTTISSIVVFRGE
jgi:hypothetical protein